MKTLKKIDLIEVKGTQWIKKKETKELLNKTVWSIESEFTEETPKKIGKRNQLNIEHIQLSFERKCKKNMSLKRRLKLDDDTNIEGRFKHA